MKYKILNPGWLGGKNTLIVSSPFGYRKKYKRMHNGIDISVKVGTTINAPLSGTLSAHFDPNGYGMYHKLVSGNITLIFAHLSTKGVDIGKTKQVDEGEPIAKTGGAVGHPWSGRSTGPHLHFEYRYNGNPIDPKYILGETLTGSVKRNCLKAQKTSRDKYVDVYTTQKQQSSQTSIDSQTDESATEQYDPEHYNLGENLANGIWQIVKLAMDSNVANLRLHDTSISVQTGQLSNFFNKICQQPLVEFSGDTYGDQYYFLVRKPPFDAETMRKTLDVLGILNYDSSENNDNPYIIKPMDIISSNISYGVAPIYSWYQFYPIYEMGDTNDLQYIIPAVFFPEFAAIWGSKDFTVRSQYRTFVATDVYDDTIKDKPTKYGDTEVRHAINDLRYIIECNAYNAFTRSGSISLVGNRKIKRGTFVLVELEEGLQEIFYVEAVNQTLSVSNNSIQRVTTLQLSHGMVKKYMFDNVSLKKYSKEPGDEVVKTDIASYFNIIDFGDFEQAVKDNKLTMDNWREYISSWKVNQNVFKFFLRKYQFLV